MYAPVERVDVPLYVTVGDVLGPLTLAVTAVPPLLSVLLRTIGVV
jgi:hypothetical protein